MALRTLVIGGIALGLGLYFFFHGKKKKPATSATSATSVTLITGQRLPLVGLGTWKSQPGQVAKSVEAALDAGYRHIDCAAVYGNEKEIGDTLRNRIGKDIKREDLFIVSKLWNTFHEAKDVLPACQQTLTDLGLEYLDLYLIHWPISFVSGEGMFPKHEDGTPKYANVDLIETWRAMENLVEMGLVKAIGVSNFNSLQIGRVIREARIRPTVLQIECHPYLNQERLIAFAEERGIKVVAFSPLGSPDRPWATPDDPSLLQDPRLLSIAQKYKKVLLKFFFVFKFNGEWG